MNDRKQNVKIMNAASSTLNYILNINIVVKIQLICFKK